MQAVMECNQGNEPDMITQSSTGRFTMLPDKIENKEGNRIVHSSENKKHATQTKDVAMCQHCNHRVVNKPRRLCQVCYANKSIRYSYYTDRVGDGGQSRYRHPATGSSDFFSDDVLGEPTNALPGTEEKIRVMVQRAAKGQSVFHPLDAHLSCQ